MIYQLINYGAIPSFAVTSQQVSGVYQEYKASLQKERNIVSKGSFLSSGVSHMFKKKVYIEVLCSYTFVSIFRKKNDILINIGEKKYSTIIIIYQVFTSQFFRSCVVSNKNCYFPFLGTLSFNWI